MFSSGVRLKGALLFLLAFKLAEDLGRVSAVRITPLEVHHDIRKLAAFHGERLEMDQVAGQFLAGIMGVGGRLSFIKGILCKEYEVAKRR